MPENNYDDVIAYAKFVQDAFDLRSAFLISLIELAKVHDVKDIDTALKVYLSDMNENASMYIEWAHNISFVFGDVSTDNNNKNNNFGGF